MTIRSPPLALALALSVDKKSQIQALDREQPVLPMMPGMPELQRDFQDLRVWVGMMGKKRVPLCCDAKSHTIPNELRDQLLPGGAASDTFEQGGLLDSLKKALTERALNAEMDHHLAGNGGAGNTRNGYGRKTVMTETGKLAIDVPRDRQSSLIPS